MLTDWAGLSVKAGGLLHLGWALFHLGFPRVFAWEKRLEPLDEVNQGIVPVLNLCLSFYLLAAALVSLLWTPSLLASGLGRQLLALMGAFWLFRLGLQFIYFKAAHPFSRLLICLFLLSGAAYILPLWLGAN